MQFVLLITKTYKTFVYLTPNLATARFIPAFRLFQLTSIMLGEIVFLPKQDGFFLKM